MSLWRCASESKRQRVEQPTREDTAAYQPAEQAGTEPKLLRRIVTHQCREDEGHEEREHCHDTEVSRHLRPCATSNASSTTSMLSSPATMRNALPYSKVCAITRPAPAPIAFATK